MLTDLVVKTPPLDTRTCCVCCTGKDDFLGLLQYAGRAVMEARDTDNPWAHEMCIPTIIRKHLRPVAGR